MKTLVAIAALLCAANARADEPDACISGDFVIGCRTEAQLDEIAASKRDEEAVKKLLMVGLASGLCHRFEDGERVYVMERAIFAERRKVKLPGELVAYWMPAKWTKDIEACGPEPTRAESRPPRQEVAPAAPRQPSSSVAPAPPLIRQPAASACEVKSVMTDADLAACRAETHSRP